MTVHSRSIGSHVCPKDLVRRIVSMEDEVIGIVRPLDVIGVSVDERSSEARRDLGALKTNILRNELD